MSTTPDFTAINAYVRRAIAATDEELAFYNGLLQHRLVPKKTIIFPAGAVCEFEGYLVKGCLRSYIIDDKGAECVLNFAVEDWWFGDLASYYEGRPSRIFVETIEPCEVLLLRMDDKERLLERHPRFERMYRQMLQRSLGVVYNRLFATMSKSAQERYREFLERYPQIPQRVPQHLIASYLGVSPEFLSKIRARMSEEGE
jgi:CRP-like cAMP-binding protein